MGFESNFDMNDIIKNHEEFLNNVIESMKEAMIFALIEVVNLAKVPTHILTEQIT